MQTIKQQFVTERDSLIAHSESIFGAKLPSTT